MKQGKTLVELAAEIMRQKESKVDYLADTRKLEYGESPDGTKLSILGEGKKGWLFNNIQPVAVNEFGISEIAHSQIAQKLSIPAKYYDRLRETQPDMLAYNVNELFKREPSTQMIRTLDGTARAFLSDRYRAIDNDVIAEAVLPIIGKWMDDGAEIMSSEITDRRLYIKVVLPKVQAELSVGDVVQSGIVISNSEVGHGSVSVSPLVYRLVCKNGMIRNDARQRKIHVGRVNSADSNFVVYRDETIEADDKAFLMKLQDVVKATADEVHFENIVNIMRVAQGMPIEGAVPEVVQLVSKNHGLTEGEGNGVLDHLIRGGDLSLFGISSAVTRHAHDVPSYDRSTELEGVGFEICAMSPAVWKRLNEGAKV
jgi:hypothetical protein